MEDNARRIAHAFYLKDWSFEEGLRPTLLKDGMTVQPNEYESHMKGHLFCPRCFTNLNRIPQDKDVTTSNMEAHFKHLPRYKNIRCPLRSKKAEGKKYTSVESVRKAIQDEELVIVKGFMKDKPVQRDMAPPSPFDEAQVDDIDGDEANVAFQVHNGESILVPSKITSLRGICRNFDKNYYRYYYFEGQQHAIALTDLLHDAAKVTETSDIPRLYFVKLRSSKCFGQSSSSTRMTFIECSNDAKDFCIKTQNWLQTDHGINSDSRGRYALVYGQVTMNGIGFCFEDLGWGELSILPEKYNYLIEDVYVAAHA